MTAYGAATEAKILEVVDALRAYGGRSIVALAGVPGTGKTYVSSIAAQRFTGEPLLVREVQFHQSFSYEEFIEGMRMQREESLVLPGVFLEWNDQALEDSSKAYVILIEELTRANLPAVLGELLTYVEHRDRNFLTVYSRRPVRVAPNLAILATYNPADRSAIEIDAALLRRLRVITFPPDVQQLREMLAGTTLSQQVLDALAALFDTCRKQFKEEFDYLMPFGHGIFAEIQNEVPDLNRLWNERIVHMLRRPLQDPHMFTDVIERNYPWRDPSYRVPAP